jgi:hypothetical protein
MPWRHLGREEIQLLLILNLGTRWGWVVNITPWLRFTLGKGPPAPIEQEAGWAPEPVWTQRQEEKSSASVGDQTLVVQSVVGHYTDWATPALFCNSIFYKNLITAIIQLNSIIYLHAWQQPNKANYSQALKQQNRLKII